MDTLRVTRATGTVGVAQVRAVRSAGVPVRAAVRSPADRATPADPDDTYVPLLRLWCRRVGAPGYAGERERWGAMRSPLVRSEEGIQPAARLSKEAVYDHDDSGSA
jgi:hypothetical protein